MVQPDTSNSLQTPSLSESAKQSPLQSISSLLPPQIPQLSRILPLQSHENAIKYMSKSKLLLHPALNESNSNAVREAYYHKCLPLITRNVGYYELFPTYLICDNYTTDEWISKVEYIIKNYDKVKNTVINFNTDLDISKLLF